MNIDLTSEQVSKLINALSNEIRDISSDYDNEHENGFILREFIRSQSLEDKFILREFIRSQSLEDKFIEFVKSDYPDELEPIKALFDRN